MRGRRLDRLTKGPTFADLDIITHLPEKCKGFLKKSFVKPNIFLQSPEIGKTAADFASQNPFATGLGGEKARSDSEVERDFERRTDLEVRIALPHGRGAGAPFSAV